MNLHSTSRIDEERVRQPFQLKVDYLAEKRVDFYVGTSDSLEFAEGKNWQAFRNYQSCQQTTACKCIRN